MKKLFYFSIILFFANSSSFAQLLPKMTLFNTQGSAQLGLNKPSLKKKPYSPLTKPHLVQPKKRKTVNTYVGAGYSFVIFTASDMNKAYPVFDTRSGDFMSEVNLFFGFSIAKAVTLEFEPSILFTRNNRSIRIILNQSVNIGGQSYSYVYPSLLSMLAFPLAANARFFPFYKQKGFIRLFFIGAGGGTIWIREEYDNNYTNNPAGIYFGDTFYPITESTSQWAPLLRLMTGFTGTGGQFGFGGELRYNFIPLKKGNEPFATRFAPNFNSVDITLRFYFSL